MNTSTNIKKLIAIFAICFTIACLAIAMLNGPFAMEANNASTKTDSPTATSGEITKSEISRVSLYSSLEELSKDSDVVLTGVVKNQKCVKDIDDSTSFVLATVSISSIEKGQPVDEQTVVVRQTADEDQSILEDGQTYLFYLVESELDGDLADQYYITGATAGVYKQEQTSGNKAPSANGKANFKYDRVDADSGDSLPETVSSSEVEQAVD